MVVSRQWSTNQTGNDTRSACAGTITIKPTSTGAWCAVSIARIAVQDGKGQAADLFASGGGGMQLMSMRTARAA